MNIIIKSKDLKLTPAIDEYIILKIGSLDRLLKKMENYSEIKTEVEIARTTQHHRHGNVFYAEVNLHLPRKILRAEHSDWNIRVAIDNVKNKLSQEIKKYKEEKKGAIRKKEIKARGK